MKTLAWGQRLAQFLTWLVAYLLLLAIRGWFERWLIARFQNRQARVPIIPPLARSPNDALYALLAIGNIVVGALVPLAPPPQVGEWAFAANPFSRAEAGALYVLASVWTSIALVATVGRANLGTQHRVLDNSRRALFIGLPLLLIVLSLVVTSGAIDPNREGTLHLDTLIALQDDWAGTRCFAVLQPLAFALWLACVPIPFVLDRTHTHNTLAGQALSLNLTLLTSVLFFGGWQGPGVESIPWLGLLYTGLKVLAITLIGAWAASSLPRANLKQRAHTAWVTYTPLSAINLLVTAIIAALGTS